MAHLPHPTPTDRAVPLAGARLLLRSRAGSTALEFALVALPFILMILGVAEVSRLIWTKSAMHSAVEAAARCAVVNEAECGTLLDVQKYSAARMLPQIVPDTNFTLDTCYNGKGKKVIASVRFNFLLRSVFPSNVLLTAESCYPLR